MRRVSVIREREHVFALVFGADPELVHPASTFVAAETVRGLGRLGSPVALKVSSALMISQGHAVNRGLEGSIRLREALS